VSRRVSHGAQPAGGCVHSRPHGHHRSIAGARAKAERISRGWCAQQFASLAKEVGWNAGPGDSDEQKALRASLLGILGGAGDPDAVAAAQKITQAYIKDTGSVEGTIVGPALGVAAETEIPRSTTSSPKPWVAPAALKIITIFFFAPDLFPSA